MSRHQREMVTSPQFEGLRGRVASLGDVRAFALPFVVLTIGHVTHVTAVVRALMARCVFCRKRAALVVWPSGMSCGVVWHPREVVRVSCR